MYRAILIALVLLAVAGIIYIVVTDPASRESREQPSEDVGGEQTITTYVCPDGTELIATFAGVDSELVYAGSVYEIEPEESEQNGQRYATADGSFVLTVAGQTAQLEQAGTVLHEGCQTPSAITDGDDSPDESANTETESFTSESLPGTWRFTLNHPESVSVDQAADTIYEFKLIGPDSELNTEITDGLYLSMQVETADVLGQFVESRQPAGTITQTEFNGYPAYEYTTISELGGDTVDRISFMLPGESGPVIDISYNTYDDEDDSYQMIIDNILASLTFTLGTEQGDFDIVSVSSPEPGATVTSPMNVSGEARGTWFNEGQFFARLVDAGGQTVATATVMADGEWMTEDYVPFATELTWEAEAAAVGTAKLQLEKANPSGLPENADTFVLPVELDRE